MPKTWRAEHHHHIDQVRHLIEVEKLTQQQVADLLGKNRTTIQRWCYRYSLETQRTGPRGGELHPNWKGGRKRVGGYWYIYQPSHPHATKQGCVAEHRLVMEQTLGRYLLPGEVVHHKDGDSEHNEPDNLELFQSNADHLRHELTGRTPNWTDEGKRRIKAGVLKAAETNRRHTRSCDGPPSPPTDHLPA